MNNDKKVYVIRNLGFEYNDEYYETVLQDNDKYLGHIWALFKDKKNALQEWKRLEYEFSHKMNFLNIIGYEDSYSRLKQFGLVLDNHLKDKIRLMNQDQLFDFIHKIDCHVFIMYEYPIDLKVKALFKFKDNTYHSAKNTIDHYKGYGYISNSFLLVNEHIQTIIIKGTLETLSETPLLLSQLISNTPNLKYNQESQSLQISPDEKTLNSVNALLKNPLYEIRYLTIQEIYEIEQTLNTKTTIQ